MNDEEEKINGIGEEVKHIEEEIVDDLPSYNKEEIDKLNGIWDYIVYFKWVINFVLIALPWTVLTIAANGFNIWF